MTVQTTPQATGVPLAGYVNAPTSTFANLPAAASAPGMAYLVTDIGSSGSLFYSTGTYWTPAGGSAILLKCALPIGSPSTCNMGNNGVFTAMTAQATTYSGGGWWYWGAGTIAAGVPAVATMLWTVFSSTTAGQVYNNAMPATGFPTPPASLTPFVTTGIGAGDTGNTAATTLLTIPLPGGSMGANGKLRITAVCSLTNNANNKNFTVKLGSFTGYGPTLTSQITTIPICLFSNINAQNSQKCTTAVGAGPGTVYGGTVDTSVSQNITFNITDAVATDNFVLEDVLIELIRDGA